MQLEYIIFADGAKFIAVVPRDQRWNKKYFYFQQMWKVINASASTGEDNLTKFPAPKAPNRA